MCVFCRVELGLVFFSVHCGGALWLSRLLRGPAVPRARSVRASCVRVVSAPRTVAARARRERRLALGLPPPGPGGGAGLHDHESTHERSPSAVQGQGERASGCDRVVSPRYRVVLTGVV